MEAHESLNSKKKMTFKLQNTHWSRIFVLYDKELRQITSRQALCILQYQLGMKFNKKYLKISEKPYFVENKVKRDIYFKSW